MTLMLPRMASPDNLSIPDSLKVTELESDLYDICSRVKTEVDGGERLTINILEKGDKIAYAVVENTDHGPMLVCKIGEGYDLDELDSRLITKLQYLLRVPHVDRVKKIEEENKRYEERLHQAHLEEMYENIGGEMRHELYRCGFIDSLGMSLPNSNKLARRSRAEYAKRNGTTPSQ